ncbi:sodium-dependent transporter bedraggled isoform 2-T3 [Cochliomyia hominivorax]
MSFQNTSLQSNNMMKVVEDVMDSGKTQSDLCTENISELSMSHGLDSLSIKTASLRKPKAKSLSYNFGSSISLDKFTSYGASSGLSKFLSNEAINNFYEYIDGELSDDDLIEIQNTPNFQNILNKKSLRFKKFGKKNDKYQECSLFGRNIYYKDSLEDFTELNIALDGKDDNFNVKNTTSDCEQSNVEQCLLELDNYLEKMDEGGCMLDINTDINKKSFTRIPKGVYTSSREKHSSGMKSQFERNSRLRNTISFTSSKQTTGWIPKHKEISKEEILDINVESRQRSINAVKMNAFKVENPPQFCGLQVLSEDKIFQNIMQQQEVQMNNIEIERPRQFGRRSERLRTITATSNNENQNYEQSDIILRPITRPVSTVTSVLDISTHDGLSDESTNGILRNTSLVSVECSTDSGESLHISNNISDQNNTANEENNEQNTHNVDSENIDMTQKFGFNSYWPHSFCRTLALISCTLGLFNINRFAVLTINYGGNFLIQFLILSVLFGIPFLWLQMSLGAKIEAGPITMWKISPICMGIGISLIFVQYIVTIYSSVAAVWLLVYIKDIIVNHTLYPWSNSNHSLIPRQSNHILSNLTESIPDYFNGYVLQRLYIFKNSDGNEAQIHISDRGVFYLAILWAIVFLILCKGLKSFGNMIIVLGLLPISLLAAITVKLLSIVDFGKLQKMFSFSEFDDFLINSKSWAAAAQEVFLTWGILGASVLAMSSRKHRLSQKLTLRNDAILVVLVTFIGLCLSALIGVCIIQVINEKGYVYVPGSYESPEYYSAIYSLKTSTSNVISYPIKYVPHYSTLIGEVYRYQADVKNVSGYQVLRFVTEILPAALAISTENISWIWAVLIFLMLLAFGLAQLCVMWNPISFTLGNSTSAVLLSCVSGLLLSIPFATEIGITFIHYIDILLGGAWFIPVFWVAEIFGVFLIRGRPYNGDDLVNDLRMPGWVSAFLALSWNVLLPIGLITLAILEYKVSISNQFYYWRGKSYFNFWSRKIAAFTQIGLLLLVPLIAMVQIYRYLSSGPPDILDRIQMLYRPMEENDNIQNIRNASSILRDQNNENSTFRQFADDEPPKYTPPPSYTTATGARLAKILRQSLRHSVTRILGNSRRQRLSIQPETQNEHGFHPPEYASTSNNQNEISSSTHESINVENGPPFREIYDRSLSLDRRRLSKAPSRRTHANNCNFRFLRDRPYTAEDVISTLRSSTLGRRRVTDHSQTLFRSIENLVQNAEPFNISAASRDCLKENEQSSS